MKSTDFEDYHLSIHCSQERTPRVFIAEDSLLISLDLEKILNDMGCEVVGTSRDITGCLEFVDPVKIDVAIVDYVLSDGTCEQLINALRAHAIPFAICSGYASQEIESHYPDVPVLLKPYNPDDVCRVMS